MDRQRIADQLRLAEEQRASCAQSIARHGEVIAKLEQDGQEISSAGALFTQLLLLHALQEVECERLSQQLAEHGAPQKSA